MPQRLHSAAKSPGGTHKNPPGRPRTQLHNSSSNSSNSQGLVRRVRMQRTSPASGLCSTAPALGPGCSRWWDPARCGPCCAGRRPPQGWWKRCQKPCSPASKRRKTTMKKAHFLEGKKRDVAWEERSKLPILLYLGWGNW